MPWTNTRRASSDGSARPRSTHSQAVAARTAAIAEFYAGSKAKPPPSRRPTGKGCRGEVVFRNRCEECHPDNGREGDRDGPRLAAQNPPYMLKQIRLFVSGKEVRLPPGQNLQRDLSDADLEAVAHSSRPRTRSPRPSRKRKSEKGRRAGKPRQIMANAGSRRPTKNAAGR